jgi:opacity protein-like surface antigen
LFALVLFVLPLLAAPQARGQAQIEFGPRVGYEIDQFDALTLGGDVRVSTAALPVKINGTVDYFFLDDDSFEASQRLLKFAVNGLFEFGIDNQYFTPYAGPGLSVTRYSLNSDADIDGPNVDFDDGSETDVGINAVGGAEFGLGGLRPFVQAEFVLLGDAEPVQLTAGLLFTVGGR